MSETSDKPPWRLPISAYLGLGLGGLVLLALGLLLWITLSAVIKNTTELLQDKSRLLLGSLTDQTSLYLDATLAPSKVVANRIASGRLDPTRINELMGLQRTLLAAAPEVDALAYFDVNGTRTAAFRRKGRVESDSVSWRNLEEVQTALDDLRSRTTARWGPPIYNEPLGSFLNYRLPVFKDDILQGMVTALITVRTLSNFLGGLETEAGQNSFILYDRDYVLAHAKLTSRLDGLSEDQPLPKITEIGDPVLANIWREGWEDNKLVAGTGHADESGDTTQIFLYAPLDDYADAPWQVGSYFASDAVDTQVERMWVATTASLMLVALTLISTYLLGRFLRRPINQLADAATAIRALDLEKVPAIQRSRFAELDDAGQAFNAMASALQAFSHYVPKDLVEKLMTRGDVDKLNSEARDVTVLMTDIVGFTARAEKMTAIETADFLNHHLGLVTHAIEEEGGIVDKYIGDAVMALWGAIDDQPDHTLRAIAAAARIGDAIKQDNLKSDDAVRLRIGIHSGPVVVGNIGTVTRMNYTVVGDTVNTAQRLETLGKTLMPEQDIAVLMSAEVADAVKERVEIISLGRHGLRGRAQEMEIFTLSMASAPSQKPAPI